ncbi:RcnB family protein [Xanthomonas fragariae]|uniref:RcnB family protein n=1 Tax=Xanthomonas fragariae TaxID=48664 RepID=UPI0022AB1C48|nr:RcnB family protein [Xanthomonas fragariae]WAT14490.1 RcnB family protein [Xanthomonas fragariae]
MNRKRLVTVVLSSILALGSFAPAAFAGDWDRDHDRRGPDRDQRSDWRNDRHDDRRDWRDDRRQWREDRHYYSNGYREGYREARHRERYDDRGRGYAYYPARPVPPPYWARGQRYYGPDYVINDYSRYNLRRPPYGYRWQRDDAGNLLLVAIATGVIADLVLHH